MSAPLMLAFVGWSLQDGDSAPGEIAAPLFILVLFWLSLAAPFVVVPVMRRSLSRQLAKVRESNDRTFTLAGVLNTRMFMEFALWELPTLMAFAAYFSGAPLPYLFGAALVTFAGSLYSFPRASVWEAAADAVTG